MSTPLLSAQVDFANLLTLATSFVGISSARVMLMMMIVMMIMMMMMGDQSQRLSATTAADEECARGHLAMPVRMQTNSVAGDVRIMNIINNNYHCRR